MAGRDVQLQAAIDYIQAEMKKHPAGLPPRARTARVSEGGWIA